MPHLPLARALRRRPASYRKADEVAEWRDKDPIRRFTSLLQQRAAITANEIEALAATGRGRVDEAVAFMTRSPLPEAPSVADYVYA